MLVVRVLMFGCASVDVGCVSVDVGCASVDVWLCEC